MLHDSLVVFFEFFFKSSTQTGMVIPLCQHVFRMGCKYESGAI